VQVFRFTLGIPGFDDSNIPRVVGVLGATLLVVNHVISASPVPDVQARFRLCYPLFLPTGFTWCAHRVPCRAAGC
jgi:hypothetical protein